MITEATLQAVFAKLAEHELSDALISQLRTEFAPLHFTYCSDDDVSDTKPALTHARFNVYLIDGREHCLCLTNDASIATGLVIAEIYPDE